MAARNPLVLVSGQVQELPAGDTVNGGAESELLHPAVTNGVRDTTTGVGTGALVLAASPPTGYAAFSSAYVDSQALDYCVQGATGEWEVGTGVYSADPYPYFSSISLLLHGNGTNGGTTFPDSSNVNGSVTYAGGIQTSTAQIKMGSASLLFNGTSGYLSVPANTALVLGTDDFTIEAWVYPTSFSTIRVITGNSSAAAETNITLAINANGTVYVASYYTIWITSSSALSLNTWSHVACVRSGSTMTLYINGVSVGSATHSNNLSGNLIWIVGRDPSAGQRYFSGHIDELCVTKGVARYTSAFSPPTNEFTSTGVPSLVRSLVRASSNAGALVNFSAGTKQVFDLPHAANTRNAGLGRQYAHARAFALP